MPDKQTSEGFVTITVNTREKVWYAERISYEQVLILAFGSFDESIIYTVTYSGKKSGDMRRQGTLAPGQDTNVEDGMIFNAANTGNA